MAARKATFAIGTDRLTVAPTARNRKVLILSNVGTVPIYINQEDVSTTGESFPLGPGDKLETSDYLAMYALTASGSGLLGVWDDCG